ncbi:MAG: DUF502 domain-containing protein [Saprospiraceae bacterium]|nr:DUF502 domain-containing protein [Saprospiraceae bacterium]MCB9322488.1 DUF502 domain-containing protein [Lewinellaceae bacterium]
MQKFFVTTVIGGIFVLLPFGLLVWIVKIFFKAISNLISPLTQIFKFPPTIHLWVVDLVAFGLVIGLFFFIGLFVRTTFGHRLFNFVEENWLRKLPIYGTLRDAISTFTTRDKTPFRQVVLVDVFSNPTRMTGFVTDELESSGYVTVFVPTGPNPTNGFIFHVKKDQLEYLDIKPEDAMRTIIGVGVGSDILFEPGAKKDSEPKAKELIQN